MRTRDETICVSSYYHNLVDKYKRCKISKPVSKLICKDPGSSPNPKQCFPEWEKKNNKVSFPSLLSLTIYDPSFDYHFFPSHWFFFYSFQNIPNYLIFSAHTIVSCISLLLSYILRDPKPFFKMLPGKYSTWFALSTLICNMTSLQSHRLNKLSKLLMILSVSQFHLVWTSHHNHAVTLLNMLSFYQIFQVGKSSKFFCFVLLILTRAALLIHILLISYINSSYSRKVDIWLSFTEPYL